VNSAGIALRRQPIDSQLMCETTTYRPGTNIRCTHMVQASSGVKFYRVEDTDGWVFDAREGHEMLRLLSEQRSSQNGSDYFSNEGNGTGWSPDFVRGVAAGIEGVTDLSFNERSRVISFHSPEADVRINVYYTTRTIGTALTHPSQGATQLFRRNCTTEELVNIFENPRVHTGRGYKRRRIDPYVSEIIQTPYGQGLMADHEAEVRIALLELDEDIAAMNDKRQCLLKRIRDVDLDRAKEANKMKMQIDTRNHESVKREEAGKKKKDEEIFKINDKNMARAILNSQYNWNTRKYRPLSLA